MTLGDFITAIVGYADLTSVDLDDILKRHCQSSRFRGIRHMLNFHPDKPQYNAPTHDNYLTDPAWIKGFGLLEKYNLSFDLHVLPRQMHRCVTEVGLALHFQAQHIIAAYVGRVP